MSYIGKLTAAIGSAIVATAAVYAAPAAAQATRTWVSGVGDDANPCSRTAPCKTFAGAISKTAAGGQINCIDPGGFGGVTITKAITIDCEDVEAGVLVSATNGIIVNAGATDVVFLNGLDIFGVGTGLNGVRFLNGGGLHIRNSIIRRFNGANGLGVSFAPSGAAELFITNTTIADNGVTGAGGGIEIKPTGSGTAKVTLTNVTLQNNENNAFRVDTTGLAGSGVQIAVNGTTFAGSAQGVALVATAGNPIIVGTIAGSVIANNTGTGVVTNGSGVSIRMGGNTIVGNATGVNPVGGSFVQSFGDNYLAGNTADGAFNGVLQPKK